LEKLSLAQAKDSTFDRELLACYLAIRHFRWLLEGCQFYLVADHNPLTFALSRVADAWTSWQQHQVSYVAGYTTDIRHVPGKQNVSRPAAAVTAPAAKLIDFEVLAAEQLTDSDTQELEHSGTLRIHEGKVVDKQLLCDVSTGIVRPLVPVFQCAAVFHAIHGVEHPCTCAIQRLISQRCMWRGCAVNMARL
jgi:hypothetical protein